MDEARANPVDWHEPDMLVVDTAHVELVENLVRDFLDGKVVHDDRLKLSLVTLTSADKAADAVLESQPGAKQYLDQRQPASNGWTAADRLLENLRAAFKDSYDWTPTMGKNRLMTPVEAVTYPNAGGTGGPEPISYGALQEVDRLRGQHQEKGRGVLVGLPDTVLYPHPTLTGTYVLTKPTADQIQPADGNGSGASDSNVPYIAGHCCQVASLILREAPAARLDIRPVLTTADSAKQNPSRSVWDVARRMAEYLDSGIQIINCSWACLTWDRKPPLVLERVMSMLTPTIMVVAAASNHGQLISGNDDSDSQAADKANRQNRLPDRFSPAFPAALPNVIAVGALDGEHAASFNPVVRGGDGLAPWIDVLAPGVDTIGAYFGSVSQSEPVDVPVKPRDGEVATEQELEEKEFQGAAKWTGTSFAAATVTGAIAARIKAGTSAQKALDDLLRDGGRIRRAHP